jgi:flagellar biosynthesis/type III secretory pathway M-ring protein FliF/YscJ
MGIGSVTMQEWIVPVVLGVVAVLVLVLVVAFVRARSRTRRELLAARAEAASVRAQLDEVERRMSAHDDHTDYVITRLGDDEPESGPSRPVRIDGSLFADLLLRETVVKSVALAHGVRRALAPEVRNRIRFEMKREVQRARKQRRSDLKEALREFRARERADLAADAGERHDEGDAA